MVRVRSPGNPPALQPVRPFGCTPAVPPRLAPCDSPIPVTLTVEQLWQPVPGGSGTYIRGLVGALGDRDDVAPSGLAAWHGLAGAPTGLRVRRAVLPRRLVYAAWPRVRTPRAALLLAPGRGVLHATTWAVPPHRGPLVVTVHDLAFLRDPGHFTPHGNRFFRRALEIVRDEADVVVVPSEATALDCVTAGIDRDRVRVIPHGVTAPEVTADEVASFRADHGLEHPYVLWTGTFEPRKNVPTLLDAYARVVSEASDLDLVLVGPSGWGGADEAVSRRLDDLPRGRVHRLGHLPPAALHRAYAGATAFCFPSTWEGFGLPVLEAMAHGVPVITSAGTSMAEVCGEAGLLVDPASPDELAAAVLEAAGARHDELSRAGLARSAEFTWQRSAALHVAAYRDAEARRDGQ